MMDRSFADEQAATARKDVKAAAAFASINAELGGLLDIVDGADTAPTNQAVAAVGFMENRLKEAESNPTSKSTR
jgi:hypothetical protein